MNLDGRTRPKRLFLKNGDEHLRNNQGTEVAEIVIV